jgi:hypothetical protein
MPYSFNIIASTRTSIAREIRLDLSLLALLVAQGTKSEDWGTVEQKGLEAEELSLTRKEQEKQLASRQLALNEAIALLSGGINDIKIRKASVLRDLAQDPNASHEDKTFVATLSFGLPAPAGQKRKQTTKRKATKEESAAREALRLQLGRMLEGIAGRSVVAAAFAGRGLDAAAVSRLTQLIADVPVLQRARDDMQSSLSDTLARIHRAVAAQSKVWDSVRKGFARVARRSPKVKQLNEHLKAARAQARKRAKPADGAAPAKAARGKKSAPPPEAAPKPAPLPNGVPALIIPAPMDGDILDLTKP